MTSPAIYQPGEAVELYCDIQPGTIDPLPPGVPNAGRLRVIVTQRAITVAWMRATGEVDRVDVPVSAEDTKDVTYLGGQVGDYVIGKAPGCSSCGASTLMRWLPFESIQFMHRMPPGQVYGVPPARNEVTTQTYRRP